MPGLGLTLTLTLTPAAPLIENSLPSNSGLRKVESGLSVLRRMPAMLWIVNAVESCLRRSDDYRLPCLLPSCRASEVHMTLALLAFYQSVWSPSVLRGIRSR